MKIIAKLTVILGLMFILSSCGSNAPTIDMKIDCGTLVGSGALLAEIDGEKFVAPFTCGKSTRI